MLLTDVNLKCLLHTVPSLPLQIFEPPHASSPLLPRYPVCLAGGVSSRFQLLSSVDPRIAELTLAPMLGTMLIPQQRSFQTLVVGVRFQFLRSTAQSLELNATSVAI